MQLFCSQISQLLCSNLELIILLLRLIPCKLTYIAYTSEGTRIGCVFSLIKGCLVDLEKVQLGLERSMAAKGSIPGFWKIFKISFQLNVSEIL